MIFMGYISYIDLCIWDFISGFGDLTLNDWFRWHDVSGLVCVMM